MEKQKVSVSGLLILTGIISILSISVITGISLHELGMTEGGVFICSILVMLGMVGVFACGMADTEDRLKYWQEKADSATRSFHTLQNSNSSLMDRIASLEQNKITNEGYRTKHETSQKHVVNWCKRATRLEHLINGLMTTQLDMSKEVAAFMDEIDQEHPRKL